MSDINNSKSNLYGTLISFAFHVSFVCEFQLLSVATCEVWDSPSQEVGDELQDSKDPSVFSEHELLDIMYDTCQTSSPGRRISVEFISSNTDIRHLIIYSCSSSGVVLVSTIMQYLQAMTAQSPEKGRLTSLRRLLDPDCQDPHVSRETFHGTMSEWIAQCTQDR